jgi:hypothetical protein
MEKELENKIEELVGKSGCPKGFTCCIGGLEGLCKAQDVGLATECLEENPFECSFSVPFGGLYYCECPLRIYIAKNLKK